MIAVFTTICLILSILLLIRNRKYYYNLPHGPPALPVLGSFPFLHGNGTADKVTSKALERYGKDFVTLWLGSCLTILIQDFNIAKELFSKDEFSARWSSWFHQVSINHKCYSQIYVTKVYKSPICKRTLGKL